MPVEERISQLIDKYEGLDARRLKRLMVFNAEWDEPALERARFLNLTYQEYLFNFQKPLDKLHGSVYNIRKIR